MRLERGLFDLQATFAEQAAAISGTSLHDALLRHTTFYSDVAVDNDVGAPPDRWNFDRAHPGWVAFTGAVKTSEDAATLAYEAHIADCTADASRSRCFGYDFWADLGWVRIHFGNSPDGLGLRPESLQQREEELASIFAEVAARHRDAVAVRGASWLYHVAAYRRLFPKEHLSHLQPIGHPHQFIALWGQLVDRHGRVKESLRGRFLTAVHSAGSIASLNGGFGYEVLATTGAIQHFYERYGVTRDAVVDSTEPERPRATD